MVQVPHKREVEKPFGQIREAPRRAFRDCMGFVHDLFVEIFFAHDFKRHADPAQGGRSCTADPRRHVERCMLQAKAGRQLS